MGSADGAGSIQEDALIVSQSKGRSGSSDLMETLGKDGAAPVGVKARTGVRQG